MKSTFISIIVAAVVIGGAIMLAGRSGGVSATTASADNVSVALGKQIVTITAKGGYSPRVSAAKADMLTTIRLETNGTFDCSSSVRIPSMNISKVLPQTGSTDIDVGTQQVATLPGTCGMGMYPFEVEFKS